MSIYEHPTLYERVSPGLPGDVGFCRALAAAYDGTVLEIGCGTGRITLELARAGHQVTGIDNQPLMLTALQGKLDDEPEEIRTRVQLLELDMSELNFEEHYDVILLPYRVFHHVLTVDDQLDVLARIHRALKPGGVAMFDLFDPRYDMLPNAHSDVGNPLLHKCDVEHPETGNTVVVWTSRDGDPNAQTVVETWVYDHMAENGEDVIERFYQTLELRYTFRYEMEHLLRRTGFDFEGPYSDFGEGEYVQGTEQIWLARKP